MSIRLLVFAGRVGVQRQECGFIEGCRNAVPNLPRRPVDAVLGVRRGKLDMTDNGDGRIEGGEELLGAEGEGAVPLSEKSPSRPRDRPAYVVKVVGLWAGVDLGRRVGGCSRRSGCRGMLLRRPAGPPRAAAWATRRWRGILPGVKVVVVLVHVDAV